MAKYGKAAQKLVASAMRRRKPRHATVGKAGEGWSSKKPESKQSRSDFPKPGKEELNSPQRRAHVEPTS